MIITHSIKGVENPAVNSYFEYIQDMAVDKIEKEENIVAKFMFLNARQFLETKFRFERNYGKGTTITEDIFLIDDIFLFKAENNLVSAQTEVGYVPFYVLESK